MSRTLLRLDTSARHDGSVSRALADRAVAALTAPGDRVVTRDLALGLPHLTASDLAARGAGGASAADPLLDELKAADTLVISLPIYNFGVPVPLKAWVDHVARAGITFRYTETGPQGLLTGKRAVLVVASGGTRVGSPIDFATPWLRHVLGFMGITDVTVIAADALMTAPEAAQAQADAQIAALAA